MAERTPNVSDKGALAVFMRKLADDFRNNPHEWENLTVDAYLEAIAAWIEDGCDSGTPDMGNADCSAIAKVLYMGKIYE